MSKLWDSSTPGMLPDDRRLEANKLVEIICQYSPDEIVLACGQRSADFVNDFNFNRLVSPRMLHWLRDIRDKLVLS